MSVSATRLTLSRLLLIVSAIPTIPMIALALVLAAQSALRYADADRSLRMQRVAAAAGLIASQIPREAVPATRYAANYDAGKPDDLDMQRQATDATIRALDEAAADLDDAPERIRSDIRFIDERWQILKEYRQRVDAQRPPAGETPRPALAPIALRSAALVGAVAVESATPDLMRLTLALHDAIWVREGLISGTRIALATAQSGKITPGDLGWLTRGWLEQEYFGGEIALLSTGETADRWRAIADSAPRKTIVEALPALLAVTAGQPADPSLRPTLAAALLDNSQAVDRFIQETAATLIVQAAALRDRAFASMVGFGALVLGVIAVSLFSSRWALREIRRMLVGLTQAMSRLSKKELEAPVPYGERSDDIGAMARSLLIFRDGIATAERLTRDERARQEELRKTAESLRRSQEHLARAQRIAGMGSDTRDLATDIAEWSDETYRIFGITRETFTPTFQHFLSLVHPDDRPIILAMRDQIGQGICPAPFEHRIVRPDGAIRIIRRETVLLRDETGKAVSLAGTIHDVTEQRAAQQRQIEFERQLLHSQKLDALGTLAGGIAHDLNNTLVPVLGLAKLTMGRLAEGSRERANLAMILTAGERARDLVRQILAFSRKDTPTRRAIDFAALLRELLKMLRSSLPATVAIDEAIDDVPQVLADPAQLHQIVVNLIVNAAQAIGDQMGTITVRLDVAPAGTLGTLAPVVHLSVSDTGCGMDAATEQRIFEPFFTTKAVGEGTGLGLSVVHGIVAGHGGRITVASTPGEGARFDILLPAISDEEIDETGRAAPHDHAPRAVA
jgi:PAS domain S-box-containing protein